MLWYFRKRVLARLNAEDTLTLAGNRQEIVTKDVFDIIMLCYVNGCIIIIIFIRKHNIQLKLSKATVQLNVITSQTKNIRSEYRNPWMNENPKYIYFFNVCIKNLQFVFYIDFRRPTQSQGATKNNYKMIYLAVMLNTIELSQITKNRGKCWKLNVQEYKLCKGFSFDKMEQATHTVNHDTNMAAFRTCS